MELLIGPFEITVNSGGVLPALPPKSPSLADRFSGQRGEYMTEHEYNQSEKRRTEGTAGRRYQQGGRGSDQWGRQGGQMGPQSGQQTGHETGGRMGQRSSYGTGGQPSPRGSQMGGGQMSGGQTSGQMGGGRTSGEQMGGGQTSAGRTGGQTGGRRSGQMGGHQTDPMGGQQMSQGTSQMSRGTGQTGQGTSQMGQDVGRMGGQSSQQSLIKPVTVSDVAATEVVTVQPDASVSEMVQKMSREDVGSVVVAEGNRPIGIVTDRKIALALGETGDASQLQATDLMSEDLFTVPEGANIFDLVRRLSDKGVRRIPVVGDRGDLKGIVSLDDVIVLLAEEFYNVSHIIRQQSPRF